MVKRVTSSSVIFARLTSKVRLRHLQLLVAIDDFKSLQEIFDDRDERPVLAGCGSLRMALECLQPLQSGRPCSVTTKSDSVHPHPSVDTPLELCRCAAVPLCRLGCPGMVVGQRPFIIELPPDQQWDRGRQRHALSVHRKDFMGMWTFAPSSVRLSVRESSDPGSALPQPGPVLGGV